MFDPFTLAMIGAGVGAFTNKKDPLKGALIGGTLGYGGGTAFGSGGLLGGSASGAAGSSGLTSAGAGLGANAPGAAAFNQSMGLSALPGMGTIESAGLKTIGGGSTLYNPEYFSNIMGSPIYTGNEGLLSQIGTGAGTIFDTAKNELGDSITPQNLIGVSNILSNMANTPRPVASGNNQITGTPPKFDKYATGQVYTRKKGNA
jgi:hypothetical protein